MTELVGGERRKKPSAVVTTGEKSPETKPTYTKMETPALVSVISQAMIERNKAVDSYIASETEIRRIDKEILHPVLIIIRQRYKDCKTPAERRKLIPGSPTFESYLKNIKLSTSILRVWNFREAAKKSDPSASLLKLTETTPTTIEGEKGNKPNGGTTSNDAKPELRMLRRSSRWSHSLMPSRARWLLTRPRSF
jgi:hypothetical protein